MLFLNIKKDLLIKNGIVTRDNHTVPLANISVHYVIGKAAVAINHAEVFIRFLKA